MTRIAYEAAEALREAAAIAYQRKLEEARDLAGSENPDPFHVAYKWNIAAELNWMASTAEASLEDLRGDDVDELLDGDDLALGPMFAFLMESDCSGDVLADALLDYAKGCRSDCWAEELEAREYFYYKEPNFDSYLAKASK